MASLRITVVLAVLAALLAIAVCMPEPGSHHHTRVRIHVPHKIHHIHHHHVKKVPVFVKEKKKPSYGHYDKSDPGLEDDEDVHEGEEDEEESVY